LKTLQRRKANKNILPFTVKNMRQLQHSYMPFIQNGGLFIETDKVHKMGDAFFLLLTLLDDAEQIPLAVKVVWLAGKEVKAPHKQGIGVQFTDPENPARNKIETYLTGLLSSPTATATM
jgi:type IV pilus assembly protein PilZ|tara:strand:+ start:3425 stop:3781 length:357 start_codon:yes stop_codon:yes gene_type:complete